MPWTERFDPGNGPTDGALRDARDLREVAFTWREVSGPGLPAPEVVRRVKAVLVSGWPLLAGSAHSVFVVGYVDDAEDPGGGRFVIADSGTGGYVEDLTADRLPSAISYARVGDYGFGWIEAHAPFPRVVPPR
jgi:hypothetical protein